MKIPKSAIDDFNFYLISDLDMIGHDVGVNAPSDPKGFSALECFYSMDTYGKSLPCREPDVLAKAIRSKKSINLQIKMWAEDVAGNDFFGGLLLTQEELVEYTKSMPRWVFDATMNQAQKISMNVRGWIPRFTRVERCLGNVWLPHMDRFDPVI